MNSEVSKKRKLIKIFLAISLAFVIVGVATMLLRQMLSEPPKKGLLMTTNQTYDTDKGQLTGKFIILDGNRIDFKTGQIISAIIYVDSNHACPIKNDIKIIESNFKSNVSLTLLQDSNSKEWLATEGWLAMVNNETHIIDKCKLTVIGGENSPITINGIQYYNTSFRANK